VCLACANGTVNVLLGNGDGTFRAPVIYSSGQFEASSVTVGDINGDGKPDLAVANHCAEPQCRVGGVGVLLGNGDGTFQRALTYLSGGTTAESVKLADLNGDRKPDLVLVNECKSSLNCTIGTVGVLLNQISADTTPPVIRAAADPNILWPPNGSMSQVTVSGTITDTGSGVNANSATYAVSDEYGLVEPHGMIALSPKGTYAFNLSLQASRQGSDLDGRQYTVTVSAKDNAGNTASKTAVVIVPHNR
jgi:hypothetical protein